MGKNFETISNWIQRNKRMLISVALMMFVVAILPFPVHGQTPPPVVKTISCSFTGGSTWIQVPNLGHCAILALYGLTLKLGVVANFIVKVLMAILRFGSTGYDNSPIVTVGWPIIRDLCNMLFIIALLLMSFGTIFRLKQYAIGQNLLRLIIFAGLINFSLVFVNAMIDVSEVFVQVFIAGVGAVPNIIAKFTILQVSITDTGSFQVPGGTDEWDIFVSVIIAGILTVMLIGQLFKVIWILLKRVFIFWGTLALSPILFAAPLIPGTQKLMSGWWHEFTEALLSGPTVIFFIYLITTAIAQSTKATGGSVLQDQVNELFKSLLP